MKKIIQIIIFVSVTAFAQELKFIEKFGNFSNSVSFDIDLQGNIFVSDIDEHSITKLDSIGKLITTIGGFGWDESAFDEPIDIFTNTLSLYVADKNNNRIQHFDKDLNFLSQYPIDIDQKPTFGYPSCINISGLGFLFILDNDNFRILKYNLDGQFLLEIGANNSGNFALDNPKYFSTDNNSNVYVLDKNEIKVFDQYGTGIFNFSVAQNSNKIHVVKNSLLLIDENKIAQYNLQDYKVRKCFISFPELDNEKIIDAKIVEQFLFVLTANNILKYKIIE